MKTKLTFLAILAIAVLSCQKESDIDTGNPGTVLEVNAPAGKTGISGPESGTRQVFWSAGDRLCLNGYKSVALGDSYEGATTAKFEWTDVIDGPYNVLYPASIYKDENTITLPFSQNKMLSDDGIATDTFPMYASASDVSGINMEYLCSILRIRWTKKEGGYSDNVSYVEFRGNDGEQVSGDFLIDYASGTLTPADTTRLAQSVRTFSIKASTATDDEKVCNIVVPAGTYSNGFTVRLVDAEGRYVTKTTSSSVSFTAGSIKNMPVIEFDPATDSKALCISTARELIAFAQDWNAKKWEGGKADVYLTGDLVFDEETSALFNETGGIGMGGDDNYYNGCFDGNNHSIKGLKGDCPLFAYTGLCGTVRNLTIDESCELEYRNIKNNAVFVGRHKGLLENCTCNADIDFTMTKDSNLGGLVARLYGGKIKNCLMNGTINVNASSAASNCNIGGIASTMEGSGASITGSEMNGDVVFDESFQADTLYVGLIAGNMMAKGSISSCVTSAGAAAIVLKGRAYIAAFGGIAGYVSESCSIKGNCINNRVVNVSWLNSVEKGHIFAGGVAGNNAGTISDCENKAAFSTSIARTKGASDDYTKFIYLGGISAKIATGATVKNCTNSGNFSSTSNVKQQFIGGIAGQIEEDVTLENNVSSGNITSTAGVRNAFFGGLYGQVSGQNTIAVTGSPFTGSIAISNHESGEYSYIYAGGLVGHAGSALTITGTDCSITADITMPLASVQTAETFFGGVVGGAGSNGAGKLATGAKLTVSGISVSGNVAFTDGSGLIPKYKKCGLGGIVGGAVSGADISNCISSVLIKFGSAATTSGSNGNPAHLGGIAGRIDGANSSISNCTNNGSIYNYLYNNNWWDFNNQVGINCVGGMVGSFGYNYGNKFNVTISGCTAKGIMYGYRGASGGIAGFLHKAAVSSCSFNGAVSRGAPAAGIAAIAWDSSIEGCTVKVSHEKGILGQSAGSVVGHAGGVVGLGMNCSVDNCKSFVSSLLNSAASPATAGGIIGSADSDCTVGATTACSYGGLVSGNTISSANVADYAVGTAGFTLGSVTYWNGK